MSFCEKSVTNLSSPTTCYTGLRSGKTKLASALHVLSFEGGEKRSEYEILVPSHVNPQIPRVETMICIGFSSSKPYEILIMMEPFHDSHTTVDVQDVDGMATSMDETESTKEKAVVLLCIEGKVLGYLSCSFRPLSPLLVELSKDLVLFLGSADDSRLRIYRVSVDTKPRFQDVVLDSKDISSILTFDSCVMGLDILTGNKEHFLAVGCQDGTIRLVRFDDDFGHAVETTVIIDGPIACIHITNHDIPGQVKVLAGSLCGFATYAVWEPAVKLDGPHMVADEILWNSATQLEDSVLAVCMHGDLAFVGTHSGHCMMYRLLTVPEVKFELCWQCSLPYCVFTIAAISNHDGDDISFIVTTRRSVHHFQSCEAPLDHDPYLAKSRLQVFLQRSVCTDIV